MDDKGTKCARYHARTNYQQAQGRQKPELGRVDNAVAKGI
jgi:hypothetical protein